MLRPLKLPKRPKPLALPDYKYNPIIQTNEPAAIESHGPAPPQQCVGDFVVPKEASRVVEALQAGKGVIISGMTGLGKTELARYAASETREIYPQGQIWVPMNGLGGTGPALSVPDVMRDVIRQVAGSDAVPPDRQDPFEACRQVLASKQVLVIIDDLADGEEIKRLIPDKPAALLVTSQRERYLPGLVRVRLRPWNQELSAKLLGAIWNDQRKWRTERNKISELCYFIPAVLRKAGEEIAEDSPLNPRRWIEERKESRDRSTFAGATLDKLRSSDPELFSLWLRLSVFRTAFKENDASVALQRDGVQVRKVIRELARRSLLETSDGEYRLHDSLLASADSLVDSPSGSALRALRKRATAAVDIATSCSIVEKAGRHFGSGTKADEQVQALKEFDQNRAKIERVHKRALKALKTDEWEWAARYCVRFARGGRRLIELRLGSAERIDWFSAALTGARRLGWKVRAAEAQANLGVAQRLHGDLDEAVSCYRAALNTLKNGRQRALRARILGNLGCALADSGLFFEAFECHLSHLQTARETRNPREEGTACCNVGIALSKLGHKARAVAFFEQARDLAHRSGDLYGKGTALHNLALARAELPRHPAAALCDARAALEVQTRLNDPWLTKTQELVERLEARCKQAGAPTGSLAQAAAG